MEHNSTYSLKKHLSAFILAFVCLAAMQKINAQTCSNPNNIFGLTTNGAIYPIDITNASEGSKINTAAYTGGAPNQANAIGYNSVNGKFYYFKVNPGTGSQQFVSYNPATNTYASLASSPLTVTSHAGCVSQFGTGYYCTDINGTLYFYNILWDTWTTITSTILDQFGTNVSNVISSQNSGDIAIDGLGNLWLVTSSSSNYGLYEIPAPIPSTPKPTVTAKMIISPATSVPSGSSGFQGIAFNALGQLFLSTGNNQLFQLSGTNTMSLVGIFTVSGVGGDLTSCNFPVTILPAMWSSFTVSSNNTNVSVSWGITDASNAKGFYVERSSDNKSWNALAYISYTYALFDYSFTDYNPDIGSNYYRVREVDYNNQNNYSEIKLATISASSQKIAVWPNPVKDIVNIQCSSSPDKSELRIYDQIGRIVFTSALRAGNNQINLGSFSTGNYIVHITAKDGTVYNEKIIKK